LLIAISFRFLLCCLTGFQFSFDWNFNLDGSVIVDNQSLHINTNPWLFFIWFSFCSRHAICYVFCRKTS